MYNSAPLLKRKGITMLYRSCNLLNFIRNTSRYRADQLYVLQIGLISRHASIFVISKYGTQYKVCKFMNPQKTFINKKVEKYDDWRWICMTRFLSDDAKAKKDKSEKILIEDSQQRIIELDKGKLGKLKERILDIKPINLIDKKGEQTGEIAKLNEKQSTESKESSKDDLTLKKGIMLNTSL